MSDLDQKVSSHIPVQDKEETSRFIENVFPFQIFIIRRIVKILLPNFLYEQFLDWQNNILFTELFNVVDKSLGRKVEVFNRPVANFGPKYSEYKLFFNEDIDDKYAHNVYGFGNSIFSNKEALSKALGELLERYLLANDWNNDVRLFSKTSHKLGKKTVFLTNVPSYLPWQKAEICSDYVTAKEINNTPISWVKAQSLLGLSRKYVPAHRVFWMRRCTKNEGIINHQTSNGNGGGFNSTEAILSGLYELVERDSFMCFWFFALSPKRIDIKTVTTPGVTKMLPLLDKYKLDVTFFDITTKVGIPVMLCLIIDRANPEDPKISIGAASGYSTERLFDTSFLEALVVQRSHWFDIESKIPLIPSNGERGLFDDVNFDRPNMDIRMQLWRGKKMEKALMFLFKGEEISFQEFDSVYKLDRFFSTKEELKFIKKVFKKKVKMYGEGFHPYVYHVKHPLLSKLGYSVVSVVIPNFFPLYLTEHTATLDIAGLLHWRDTVQSLGIKWEGKIKNFYPHPFP